MNDFYFVRHGQTDANLQGIMCGGVWDLELNSSGHEQAQNAALRFKNRVKEIKNICVSPMLRARQTAGYFAEHYGLELTHIEELREWNFGSWEKTPFEKIKEDFFSDKDPIGGESRKEFRARIALAVQKCQTFSAPSLVVAHGGVGLELLRHLQIESTRIENCVPHHLYQSHTGIWKFETF